MPPNRDTSLSARDGPFAAAVAGLAGQFGLPPEDARRLCEAGTGPRTYRTGAEIPGKEPGCPRLILSGWACEMRVLFEDRRQIFAFLMPGDISVAPQDASGRIFSLLALTPVSCVDLSDAEDSTPPRLPALLGAARRLNESRREDAVVRIGRMTAAERTISLLVELHERMLVNGLASGDSFDLPLTQAQMGDALGLSLVHINRTLKALRKQSLLSLRSRAVTFLQPQRLASIASAYR